MKRSPLIRMVRLSEELQSNPYRNATHLASVLEVSTRTIKRDIEMLKAEYDAPIRYDHSKKGYFLSSRWSFSLPDLTEGEVLTLLLSTSLMKQFSGTPLGTSLKSLENKIAILFQDKITVAPSDLSLLVSAQTSPIHMKKDIQPIFDCIFQAISKKKTILIRYHSLSTDCLSTRRVDPYHLYHYQGVWYFCGFCHNRKDIRDFALDRIQKCTPTDSAFIMRETFQAEQYLQKAFRMVKGKSVLVTILFDAYQAKWIRERIWHSTQKIKELPNGELLFTIKADPDEIKQWVMGYGMHAEVIEPISLRKKIQHELSEVLKKYQK